MNQLLFTNRAIGGQEMLAFGRILLFSRTPGEIDASVTHLVGLSKESFETLAEEKEEGALSTYRPSAVGT